MHGGEIFFQGKNSSREYYGHLLELKAEPDNIFKRFRDSNRRSIKKAVKSGVEIQQIKLTSIHARFLPSALSDKKAA